MEGGLTKIEKKNIKQTGSARYMRDLAFTGADATCNAGTRQTLCGFV